MAPTNRARMLEFLLLTLIERANRRATGSRFVLSSIIDTVDCIAALNTDYIHGAGGVFGSENGVLIMGAIHGSIVAIGSVLYYRRAR